MWALSRLEEFDLAYRSAAALRDDDFALESDLRFVKGLTFALLMVTPFWMFVGYLLASLTR